MNAEISSHLLMTHKSIMLVSTFLKKREIRDMGEIGAGEPVSLDNQNWFFSLNLGHPQRERVMVLLNLIQSVKTGHWMEKLRYCVIDQSSIQNCVNLV